MKFYRLLIFVLLPFMCFTFVFFIVWLELKGILYIDNANIICNFNESFDNLNLAKIDLKSRSY